METRALIDLTSLKLKVTALVIIFMSFPFLSGATNIQPGVIITKDNFSQYSSSLKELLIPGYYQHIIEGGALRRGDITIPVVEPNKRKYQPPPGFRKASRKNLKESRCSIGPGNQLLGYIDGLPFPDPQNATQLAWNVFHRRAGVEDKEFPADFRLFNSEGKQERYLSWHLWKKMWIGRTDIPPIPEIPGNNNILDSKESIIIDRPHDVKGFCLIRIRYVDIKKTDDCYSYIPALRRIRRLTGSDLTDPLLGSDCIPDDFESWRQKINPKMTFQILGIKKFLVPRHYTTEELSPIRGKRSPGYIAGTCFQVEWEIRPLQVLEINLNDPDYPYQKRLIYVETEEDTAALYGGDNYDHRGRLSRTNAIYIVYFNPLTLYPMMSGNVYRNIITGHSTMLDMYPVLGPELNVPLEVFTIRGLLKIAR